MPREKSTKADRQLEHYLRRPRHAHHPWWQERRSSNIVNTEAKASVLPSVVTEKPNLNCGEARPMGSPDVINTRIPRDNSRDLFVQTKVQLGGVSFYGDRIDLKPLQPLIPSSRTRGRI